VCGGIVNDIKMCSTDYDILTEISPDPKFIESMIQLQETDIVEYNLKMSQFRTQVQQQENSRAQAANTVKCPRCGSTNITAGQRGFSLLTGFVGSGKTVNRCANCGHKWRP
jgi:DNA-directed RNA polymerase subunit M/transcription elongation factor TFIIS